MKRAMIGVFLLLFLPAAGMFAQWGMETLHDPIAHDLTAAAEAAGQQDWARAEAAGQSAQRVWRKSWRVNAALADHTPMEDIDSLFARAAVYRQQRDHTEYAATCRELARRIEAMAQAHTLRWRNLL